MTLTRDDLLADSASTWSDDPNRLVLPPELSLPEDRRLIAFLGEPRARLRHLATRFRVRQRRAEDFFAASRNPERGLPVAANDKAFGFVGEQSG